MYQELDLNDYYYDSDDSDKEVSWGLPSGNSFNQDNIQVKIDPLTHIVTFFVPETAVLQRSHYLPGHRPAGTSSVDTMTVSIRSGGGNIPDQFTIGVLPIGLEVGVNQRPIYLTWTTTLLRPKDSIKRHCLGRCRCCLVIVQHRGLRRKYSFGFWVSVGNGHPAFYGAGYVGPSPIGPHGPARSRRE